MERILHCLPGNLDVGGIENLIISINKKLDTNIFKFDYIVHKQDKNFYEEEVLSLGGIIHRLPNKSKNFFLYKRRFMETIKKYEIIHIHSVYAFSYFEVYWAHKAGLKVILHSHNSSTASKRKIVHYLLKNLQDRFVDVRLTCSIEAARWMFKASNVNKSILINNGVEIENFIFDEGEREFLRDKYNINDNNIVLGNTSRLSKQKNPLFLLDLFNKIYQKNNEYKLVLVGDGDLKEDVEKKILELNLTNAVILVDGVKNVGSYLSLFDFFVFPSLYEGFGISLLEAQINGLYCFVNNNVPNEVIINDSSIIKNNLDDLEHWEESILQTIPKYERGISIKDFENFKIENISNKITNVYINL